MPRPLTATGNRLLSEALDDNREAEILDRLPFVLDSNSELLTTTLLSSETKATLEQEERIDELVGEVLRICEDRVWLNVAKADDESEEIGGESMRCVYGRAGRSNELGCVGISGKA
ncbi:hypothetical protein BGZ98_004884, partial [Dissophora globulifera]